MTCPTFSSRLMRARRSLMKPSLGASIRPTLCARGQSCGCARPRGAAPSPDIGSRAHSSASSALRAGLPCSQRQTGVALILGDQLHLHWVGLPDFRAVLTNRTVGGEFARTGRVQDRHACPALAVAKGGIHLLLAVRIRLV